jgi:multiple sugar transport system permease protein
VGRAIGRHALLIVVVAAMLLPSVWALGASFKPASTIFGLSPVPLPATLGNYQLATERFPLGRLLLNTLVMSAGVTAADLLVAVPAAYALARFAVRGRALATAAVGVALLVPPQALIIPQFLMTTHLGWQNTYPGLIVPQMWTCALAVVLLRQHVAALPPTLIGAAVLDGATQWEVLRHIALPLLRPALGAVAILLFINTWNEYLWPLLAASAPGSATIQPGLAEFISPENPQYGPLLAASILTSLPVIAAYLIASRRITDAFIHAGVR